MDTWTSTATFAPAGTRNRGIPAAPPRSKRRQLADAGVELGLIYADVAVSGATSVNSRSEWHLLDQVLAQGDILASMAAYVASQERQSISRRIRADLDAARAKERNSAGRGVSRMSSSPPSTNT